MTELRENSIPLDDQTVEMNLPNEPGFERVVMGSIAALAKTVGFSPPRIEDLKTAVAEACINAMQHGNKHRAGARVTVTMKFKDGIFNVSVFDEGEGFDGEPKDPDIVRIVESLDPPIGSGTFLMRHLMDSVEFRKVGNHGHEVRMAMRLGG
jgi:serine/threonine-protein kinase RsbW